MSHGLTGAVLYAKVLPRLVAFYSTVAGLDIVSRQEGFAILGDARASLVIVRIPKRISATIEIATPPERRENTAVKLTFAVEDIERARMKAAELGGVIDPAGREWEFQGMRVCDGCDPEGNVFQVRRLD